MFKYVNAFTNRSGDSLPGYYARLFDSDGNQADLFADASGTPIATISGVANAALSDENGMFRWYIANGTYDIRFYDANDVFVSVETGVPMFEAIQVLVDLSGDDGATLVGTPTGTVQDNIDARPTSAALAAPTGGGMVGFVQNGAGIISSNVETELRDQVPVTRFMSAVDRAALQAGSVVNAVSAFNAAVAYANAKGGTDRANIKGTTIVIPPGRYEIDEILTPVLVSGVNFIGSGEASVLLHSADGPTFNFGNTSGSDTIIGFGLSGVKHEYLAPPPANAALVKVSGANSGRFDNWHVHNIGCALRLGHSSSRTAAGIGITNWQGSVANTAHDTFDFAYGAGFTFSNLGLFVSGVGNPVNVSFTAAFATNVMTVTAITGTPLAVGQYIHAAGVAAGTQIASLGTGTGGTGTYNLSTSPGTLGSRAVSATGEMIVVDDRILFAGNTGFWDNVQGVNSLFERFDRGLILVASAGQVYQNFDFSNMKMDYFKRQCIYAETASGGVISGIRTDPLCWFATWSTNAIEVLGVEGFNDEHGLRGVVPFSGASAMYYNCSAKANSIDLSIGAVNRKGSALGANAYIAGSSGFQDRSAGNGDYASSGTPWRADWGLYIGADCDNFQIVGANLSGAAGFLNFFAANAAGSTRRLVRGNSNPNYSGELSGGVYALPATGVAWTNKDPFSVMVTISGGTFTNIALDGISTGLSGGALTIEPGRSFTPTYSVAGTTKFFGVN